MQMNISITPKLQSFIQSKVKSGLYGNASEVVRDALRRMDERTILDNAWNELNDTLAAAANSGRVKAKVGDVFSRVQKENGKDT